MLALLRPTEAPDLFRMYNSFECWTVALSCVPTCCVSLLLFVDGPPLPIIDICAVITFIIKGYAIHRGLAHG